MWASCVPRRVRGTRPRLNEERLDLIVGQMFVDVEATLFATRRLFGLDPMLKAGTPLRWRRARES